MVANILTKDKKGKRREEACDGTSQVYAKGSNYISRAITTLFYRAAELKELHKKVPTRAAANI